MNSIAFALSLIASLVSTPADTKHDSGIIALDRISTVTPVRKAHFAPHIAKAPVMRRSESIVGKCVTRRLEGDASSQTVTYCN